MQIALLIGLAGFLGTICRYLLGQAFFKFFPGPFPFATLYINLIGCFLIGIIYGYIEKGSIVSWQTKMILVSGFCGGFTTFSAFSIENLNLIRDGHIGLCIVYILTSVFIGLAATWGGFTIVKTLAS